MTNGLRSATVTLLIAAGLGSAGCGGGAMLTPGISADQACADSAMGNCAKIDACHKNGVLIRYGDMTTCVTRLKQACLVALGAKSSGNSPAFVETCAQAYPSASCADYDAGNIDACQPKAGTIANGSACTYSAQCQSAFCQILPGAACGTCAASPPAGAPCTYNGSFAFASQCGKLQICSKAGTCVGLGAANAACDFDAECASGLRCLGASAMAMGTCAAIVSAAGAACDRTKGPLCDSLAGLFCSIPPRTDTGMCIPFLSATDGMMCGFAAGAGTTGGTYTLCTKGAECSPFTAVTGTCKAPAAEGAACDTMAGPACLAPARCITGGSGTAGTCKLPDPTAC